MPLKRTLRFLALMIFIFVVVLSLARSSILELRARAEEEFTRQRVAELRAMVAEGDVIHDPTYSVTARGELRPLRENEPLKGVKSGDILPHLSDEPGGFGSGKDFWVYLPLAKGNFILSCTPYREVIGWTARFEAKETRNVVLVMVAFGVFTLVWMWADRRALLAAQKARMVVELERRVQERTETLKRMNRLARLGEFSASMAHEIRNPISSLVTAAKLLPDVSGREREELVGVIRRESSRLDSFLRDFLVFSKDPHPKIRMSPLHPVLERTFQGLTRSDDFREVKVGFRFDTQVREVPCDPEQIEQAFWNIALNAAQAMGGRGNLLVSTRRHGSWVEISFRDEGPGIPLEKRERIFEPLYTEKGRGTGLGLSIASRIVEAHGGFIQVESDGNSWTTFTISLPVDLEG